MATQENLQAAFAGESQANRKYLAFAKQAEKDGFKQVARLFRAAAEAETVHAHAHFRVMRGLGDTAANLRAAIAGETHEFKEMYPEFIQTAETEKESAAVASFRNAMQVEETHARLYAEALQKVQAGQDPPATPLFVCQICGHTAVGEAPETCPVCKAKRDKFTAIA